MSRHSRESNYSINTSGSVSVGFEFVDGGASLFSGLAESATDAVMVWCCDVVVL